jgi:hypothetical protein
MIRLIFIFLFITSFSLAVEFNKYETIYKLGNFSKEKINWILKKANSIKDREKKIDYLSSRFLNVPYKRIKIENNKEDKEYLVVQLSGVDCLTYLEYVEALSKSKNFDDFVKNLRYTRYRYGLVSYETRNHFFTDWIEYNHYKDYAKILAPKKAIVVKKHLNLSKGKGIILKGVPVKIRVFSYIPSKSFDKDVISKLKTGDLVGAYAYGKKYDWLDVKHVGIIIKKGDKVYFRNASSLRKYNRVVDIPLEDYLKRVKGLVILRKVDK